MTCRIINEYTLGIHIINSINFFKFTEFINVIQNLFTHASCISNVNKSFMNFDFWLFGDVYLLNKCYACLFMYASLAVNEIIFFAFMKKRYFPLNKIPVHVLKVLKICTRHLNVLAFLYTSLLKLTIEYMQKIFLSGTYFFKVSASCAILKYVCI